MTTRIATASLLLFCLGCAAGCATGPAGPTDRVQLHRWIDARSDDFSADGIAAEFVFDGVRMAVVSDVEADRMRLIAPIVETRELDPEHYRIMLIANFHSALDARYATSGGVVFAAFLHPLSSLRERDLDSALRQVANLARSFGTDYSSGLYLYGGGTPDEDTPPPPEGEAL